MMSERRFKWTCGEYFKVELTPGKRVIRIYSRQDSFWGDWAYELSVQVKTAQKLARGEWDTCMSGDSWTLSPLGCYLFKIPGLGVHGYIDEMRRAQRVARRVLAYLGLNW
jgi:hypothetical protein